MDWKERQVLVTGGASFIGSHLVDALVDRGARVRVMDDLSSGRVENLRRYWEHGGIEFRNSDLLEPGSEARWVREWVSPVSAPVAALIV